MTSYEGGLLDENVRSYHLLRRLVDQARESRQVPSTHALDHQRPSELTFRIPGGGARRE